MINACNLSLSKALAFGDYSILWEANVFPFLIFDRQLWDKAFEIMQGAPEGHMIKKFGLILGIFHV